jgi:hypothetical protein
MHNNKVDFVENLCSFVLNPLNFYLLCWPLRNVSRKLCITVMTGAQKEH